MDPMPGAQSFKGTIFNTWKGNYPCRIYVADGQVYFIRRVVAMNPGTTAIMAGQFGMLGGLAAGLAGGAAAMTQSADFVRDDDPTPPEKLLSKHAGNYAIPFSDIVDPRIEPKGKHVSYGPNAGRWHFTRRGDDKETVVLLESPADASQAVTLLGGVLGGRLKNNANVGDAPPNQAAGRGVPPEQADIVAAMQQLTELIGERVPAEWQKVRCEVRVSSPDSGRALDVSIGNADAPGELSPTHDAAIYQAATRVARKLSPSVRSFPGVVVEMTRLGQGRWQNNVKLMEKK